MLAGPQRPIRIAELTQRFPPAIGGVESHVDALAARLTESGREVHVLTTDMESDQPFLRVGPGLERRPFAVERHRAVRTLPLPRGLGVVAPGMLAGTLALRPDMIHAHAFGHPATWIGGIASRWLDVPLVIETHADRGRATPGTIAYARMMAWATLRRADRIVARTPTESTVLVSWGVDRRRIAVIPGAIDPTEFAAPSRAGASPARVILFVGRVDPAHKGLLVLLRAFARLAPELHLRLRVVGPDWGGFADLRRAARLLGIADRVDLTGAVSRAALLREYAQADLLVLPSLFEPFGVVLLEAMAAGLPVVASRVGGIPDVVSDRETAILVPPGDPGALADSISEFVRDGNLRQRFGQAGRTRVERFSWATVLPQWNALFDELLAEDA